MIDLPEARMTNAGFFCFFPNEWQITEQEAVQNFQVLRCHLAELSRAKSWCQIHLWKL